MSPGRRRDPDRRNQGPSKDIVLADDDTIVSEVPDTTVDLACETRAVTSSGRELGPLIDTTSGFDAGPRLADAVLTTATVMTDAGLAPIQVAETIESSWRTLVSPSQITQWVRS